MSERSKIIIYTKSWCGDCHRTKKFLDDYEIPYQEIDAEADPDSGALIASLNNGDERVPTLIFPDGKIMIEPSNKTLRQHLGLEADNWSG